MFVYHERAADLLHTSAYAVAHNLQEFQIFGNLYLLMMAASTLTMIPTVILFFLTQRTFIEGITLTGIKG